MASGELMSHLMSMTKKMGQFLNTEIEEINEVLGQAIYTAGLLYPRDKPTFLYWDENTTDTPYKVGLTGFAKGFAIVYGDYSTFQTAIAWTLGGLEMFCHSCSNGTSSGWKRYALTDEIAVDNIIDISQLDHIQKAGLYRLTGTPGLAIHINFDVNYAFQIINMYADDSKNYISFRVKQDNVWGPVKYFKMGGDIIHTEFYRNIAINQYWVVSLTASDNTSYSLVTGSNYMQLNYLSNGAWSNIWGFYPKQIMQPMNGYEGDLNLLTTPGIYRLGANCTNSPGEGVLEVLNPYVNNPKVVVQKFHPAWDSQNLSPRERTYWYDSVGWTKWFVYSGSKV